MTNPNDPAMGCPHDKTASGLTKREYFAAMALQGLATTTPHMPKELSASSKTLLAMAAIEMADALIAELNK